MLHNRPYCPHDSRLLFSLSARSRKYLLTRIFIKNQSGININMDATLMILYCRSVTIGFITKTIKHENARAIAKIAPSKIFIAHNLILMFFSRSLIDQFYLTCTIPIKWTFVDCSVFMDAVRHHSFVVSMDPYALHRFIGATILTPDLHINMHLFTD